MPLFGLYKIPQHHLHSDSPPAPRQVYNTMDFPDDEQQPEPAKAAIDEPAHIVNGTADAERKEKDKKRKLSTDRVPGAATTAVRAATPHISRADHKKFKSKSKDNRPPLLAEGGDGSCGSGIEAMQPKGEKAPTGVDESSSKKRKKGMRKKSDLAKSIKIAQLDILDKAKKDKAGNQREDLSTKGVPNQSKAATMTIASPYAMTPKRTPIPIPLPQKSTLRMSSSSDPLQQHRVPLRDGGAQVLMNETPSSHMPRLATVEWKAPIPFSLPPASNTAAGRKMLNNAPTVQKSQQLSGDVSAAQSITPSGAIEHEAQALTSSNLLRYTQPLNDYPKPQPRGRTASVSSVSSMSITDTFSRVGKPSPNSNFDFDPFFAPGSREKKELGAPREVTIQAFHTAFGTSQATVNFSTEIIHLQARLRCKAMHGAAGPLPCLKTATGCSSKSEQVLQLMRDDDSNVVKINICSDAEQAALNHSVAAALEAEHFLNNAVITGTPVPLGKLEGVYSLYCPSYSSAHIDKYGYGQRKLSIQRPSGFNVANNTYTARLSIPPRPMAYTILAFAAPPHASFRSTLLTTCAEGYTMDLVCLGNGYVVLTMDLGLLLTGKKSEMAGRKGEVCMEFFGVRERDVDEIGAVKWNVVEEEVEKEFKANRDKERSLGGSDVQASVEASPKKKKRGRPTNVERERRAAAAAAAAQGGSPH